MLKTLKTIWNELEIRKAFNDVCKEGAQELSESWPILLGITVVALLPFTIALICG